MRDHLSLETAIAGQKGWSLKTGSTVLFLEPFFRIRPSCTVLVSDPAVSGPHPDGVHTEGPAGEEGDVHQRDGELPGQPPGPRHRDLPHDPPKPV